MCNEIADFVIPNEEGFANNPFIYWEITYWKPFFPIFILGYPKITYFDFRVIDAQL